MSSLTDRLRGVLRPIGAGGREDSVGPPEDAYYEEPGVGRSGGARYSDRSAGSTDERDDARSGHDLAEVLDGSWCDAGGQRFLVVDRTYKPGHRHGVVTMADALPPTDGHWPRLSLLAGLDQRITRGSLLFIDLETTGLAGGAGTYAFLVGCAWFDGGTFRVRQFLLSDFGAERLLLDAVSGAARTAGAVVIGAPGRPAIPANAQ